MQRTVDAAAPERSAVLQLLDGPTAAEAKRGVTSVFSHNRDLLAGFRLVDGVATVDLVALPDLTAVPPSCRAAALRAPLQHTLTGLGATAVQFQLGGSEAAFRAALTGT